MALSEETAHELLEAVSELRGELRRVRREGLVARLSPAEREEIAGIVYEKIDERLAPAELHDGDDAPGRHGTGGGRYFKRRS